MEKVYLKNVSTQWQSDVMDLNTALLILGSQTLDQAKHWYMRHEQDNTWKNILKFPTLIEALSKTTLPIEVQVEIPQQPQIVVMELPPEPEPEIQIEVTQTPIQVIPHLVPKPIVQSTPPPAPQSEMSNKTEPAYVLPAEDTVTKSVAVPVPGAPPPVAISAHLPIKKSFKDVLKEEPPKTPATAPQGAERRVHPRYEVKLRVIIKAEKNTFLTFTKDLSLGGLNLMSEVPEYIFKSEVEIYITAPDGKNMVMFKCSPVASQLGKSRLRFTNIQTEKQKILETWVNNYIKPLVQKASG